MARHNHNTRGADYESVRPILQANLDNFETFYFNSLMKTGEHGKEGRIDGLYASICGLRNIGLEGILGGLEAQGIQSIDEGDSPQFNLGAVVENNSKVFFDSVFNLKIKDVISYIQGRINTEEEDSEAYIKITKEHEDKSLRELFHKEGKSDEEIKKHKAYGNYILSEVRNAVLAKVTPIVYQERAKRETALYTADKEGYHPINR